MSEPIKWMMVHHHSSGVDTVQFEAPDSLARDIAMAEDATAAMVSLCDLIGIDYEPENGEVADLVLLPIRDTKVVVTDAELAALAANDSIT